MGRSYRFAVDRRRAAGLAVSLLLASVAAPALAQSDAQPSAPEPTAKAPDKTPDKDIIVTGSRIVRNGYQAPTPLTVVGQDAITAGSSTPNVSSYLNTIPVFAGSLQPQGNLNATQSGSTRVNALSLRNLGTNRTLLLVDGQRVVSSTQNGASDLNSIPQQLISRVDVVTGGASAVYGSDAVAGVVNIILDHKFTGLKAEASTNITSYGDDPGYGLQLSAGFNFADKRGHITLSGETTYQAGINGDGGRLWNRNGAQIITNPNYTATNGQPLYIDGRGVGLSTSTAGGMIWSGPLKGTAFGPGGTPYQFNYGSLVSAPYMIGGEGMADAIRTNVMSLENLETRTNLLGRVDFDITDNLKVFGQFSWADPHLSSYSSNLFMPGSAGPTIQQDNAYLSASVRAAMVKAGVTNFSLGTQSGDLAPIFGDLRREVFRYTGGFSGDYHILGNDWTWGATYLYNTSRSTTRAFNNLIKANYALAVDAVVNPANGAIVCRSTLTNPGNGCVPLDVMGTGVANAAAIAYVTGTGYQNINQRQVVWDANTQGTVFDDWAGPVSLALSVAHRIESANTQTNSATQQWLLANFGAMNGSYHVTEGALETIVPVLKDAGFVKAWDFSAAARATSYSTSGFVTTWKFGTTFATVNGIRLRGTISRDIRAPGINELFSAGNVTRAALVDRLTNTTPTVSTITQGNPNLKPEDAISKSVGIVLQPAFLRGFQASVDYWSISMKNAVTTLTGQNVVDLCYQGQTQFCSQITRDGTGMISQITTGVYNYATNRTRGIDFEATYNFPVSNILPGVPGQFSLHSNATVYLEAYVNNGLTAPYDNVGVLNQVSRWRTTTTATYTNEALRVSLTGRGFTGGLYAPGAIQCSSGCPTSTVSNPTYDHAGLPGSFYLDSSINYTFAKGSGHEWEGFFNVKNLLNRDPPPAGNTNYYNVDTLTNMYDYLGRVYRVGVRIRR